MLRPLLLVFFINSAAYSETLHFISWNIESGGAEPAVIARQLAELPKAGAYLLQEVSSKDIGRLAAAIRKTHGASYKHYLGSLGGSDRLAMIIDESKFEIRSFSELFSFKDYRLNDWRHRSPLVAHLKCKGNGLEFLLITVHLARGKAKFRTEQAAGLREWAKVQTHPIILAGDCNFDFNFLKKRGNTAYRAFFEGQVWQEAKPIKRIDTNWSDSDGDGLDNYPDSSLDFGAYVPKGTPCKAHCEIIVREGDFPDDETTSDHRPVSVTVELGGGV